MRVDGQVVAGFNRQEFCKVSTGKHPERFCKGLINNLRQW